ncbi:MAG: biotin--[acetyl-CoA-carboxylase] ligase, partial [Actinobacteria bacterium]|nr:biotin--[acetyl-CoA-carboxylase] ligase [Actinomycetota bacterium]
MQITAHTPTVLGVDTEMLSAALDTSIINATVGRYWRVSVVELTASTQSDLVTLARAGTADAGDVIVANYHSNGRGRLSRSFDAPQGTALLFSLYIKPQRIVEDWGYIPLIAGASVAHVLSDFGAKLKWPNDVLIKDKKVAGLIAEVTDEGIVIGIGINVGMQVQQLPVPTATSLLIEGARAVTRNQLLAEFLNSFEENFFAWDGGSDDIRGEYLNLSATIGREVRVEYPDGEYETGLAVSISSRGE